MRRVFPCSEITTPYKRQQVRWKRNCEPIGGIRFKVNAQKKQKVEQKVREEERGIRIKRDPSHLRVLQEREGNLRWNRSKTVPKKDQEIISPVQREQPDKKQLIGSLKAGIEYLEFKISQGKRRLSNIKRSNQFMNHRELEVEKLVIEGYLYSKRIELKELELEIRKLKEKGLMDRKMREKEDVMSQLVEEMKSGEERELDARLMSVREQVEREQGVLEEARKRNREVQARNAEIRNMREKRIREEENYKILLKYRQNPDPAIGNNLVITERSSCLKEQSVCRIEVEQSVRQQQKQEESSPSQPLSQKQQDQQFKRQVKRNKQTIRILQQMQQQLQRESSDTPSSSSLSSNLNPHCLVVEEFQNNGALDTQTPAHPQESDRSSSSLSEYSLLQEQTVGMYLESLNSNVLEQVRVEEYLERLKEERYNGDGGGIEQLEKGESQDSEKSQQSHQQQESNESYSNGYIYDLSNTYSAHSLNSSFSLESLIQGSALQYLRNHYKLCSKIVCQQQLYPVDKQSHLMSQLKSQNSHLIKPEQSGLLYQYSQLGLITNAFCGCRDSQQQNQTHQEMCRILANQNIDLVFRSCLEAAVKNETPNQKEKIGSKINKGKHLLVILK